MIYLSSFTLPDRRQEDEFVLFDTQLEMQCYNMFTAYPFKIFPQKGLTNIEFGDITIFYGRNGSGKSTLLNIIAEKLRLTRTAPFNNSPVFEKYLKKCGCSLGYRTKKIPEGSEIITSDGVFDYLLDLRSINEGVDRRRSELFEKYRAEREREYPLMSMDDYENFKLHNAANRRTKSRFTAERMDHVDIPSKSNGETAFGYFLHKLGENSLYLVDEPENSLSASLQNELKKYIEDSARFYGCQFVIATHSPFLLSISGARIYDLDSSPVTVKKWSELETVRLYHDLFESHRHEFE